MGKCPCKVIHKYFIRVNCFWFVISPKFFKTLKLYSHCLCSEPFNMAYNFVPFPLDISLYKRVFCKYYYSEDWEFNSRNVIFVDCECYVKENI